MPVRGSPNLSLYHDDQQVKAQKLQTPMAEVEIFQPERRQRSSPEVIDVDLLDDDQIRLAQRRRIPRQGPSNQPIIVLDSDDEGDQPVAGGSGGQRTGLFAPTPPRPRLFSPPPPNSHNIIPPVPALPLRFANQGSYPMRRRMPPASGVVLPNAQPFPFEANIQARPRRHDSPPVQILPHGAAPPSHHEPAMGFGGALIALNNQETHNAAQPRAHHRGQRVFGLPIFGNSGYFNEMLRRVAGFDMEEAHNFPDGDNFGLLPPLWGGNDRRLFRRMEPEYKPAYTHPGRPAPGFSFNFSSSPQSPPPTGTVAGSSKTAQDTNMVLVCASCMDPLVLGGSDTEVDRGKRRLWGLRCGHLIDGKCVEELMKPAPIHEEEEDVAIDMKGKGKAIEFEIETNPIRSRLRSRHHQTPETASSTRASPRYTRPLPRRSQAKSKGKAKAKPRDTGSPGTIYEWVCPVSGCGMLHMSISVDGIWVPDETKGAIPVYV